MKHLYKYESVEKLMSDLMDMTDNDIVWFEEGIMRSTDVDITMTKSDIMQFHDDVNNVAYVTRNGISENQFIGPNGIRITFYEHYEDE